jgi:hypothetical protein
LQQYYQQFTIIKTRLLILVLFLLETSHSEAGM